METELTQLFVSSISPEMVRHHSFDYNCDIYSQQVIGYYANGVSEVNIFRIAFNTLQVKVLIRQRIQPLPHSWTSACSVTPPREKGVGIKCP